MLLFCLLLISCNGYAAPADVRDPLLEESNWIWWDKDTNGYAGEPDVDPAVKQWAREDFLFSKEIEIPGEVKAATFRVSAESVYTFSINGKEVGSDDNWMSLETYDLKPFLVPGKNKFEIKAKTKYWAAGLFFFGRVETADGKKLQILADETWDCTNAKGATKKAEVVIQGVDGGWWNNCDRVFEHYREWYELNTELATPHIPWAKPYAGGTVKVLAIVDRSHHHDLVELLHRADVELRYVFTDIYEADARYGGSRAPFFPETKGARKSDVTEAVAKALEERPDVVLFGGPDSEVFYEVAADRIKGVVASGVGLVFTGLPPKVIKEEGKSPRNDTTYEKELTASPLAEKPPSLATSVPFESLPGFKLAEQDKERGFQKVAALYQYGKGRLARLQVGRGKFAGADDPEDLHYEYYQSFFLKTLLWAAGREPTVNFQGLPAILTVDRDQPGALRFGLDGKGRYTIGIVVRSPEMLCRLPEKPTAWPGVKETECLLQPVHEISVKADGASPVELALPKLPAGGYFIDVTAADGKNAVNWATARLTVTAKPSIAGIEMTRPYIDVADSKADVAQARVTLTNGAPKGTAIHFALVDNHERVVQEQTVTVPAGETAAEGLFLVRNFRTNLGRVRATLVVGKEVYDLAIGRFTTIRRDWDHFCLVSPYGNLGEGNFGGRTFARVAVGLGFDAGGATSLKHLEAADTTPVCGIGVGSPRSPIDLDPEVLEQMREGARKYMKAMAPFDPFAYVCGDELDYGGGDAFKSRVLDFQRHMEKQYRSLAALNQQWGTDFKAFGDVYPILPKGEIDSIRGQWDAAKQKGTESKYVDPDRYVPSEEYMKTARAARNFSRLIDQWLSANRVFLDRYRLGNSLARDYDSHARVGSWAPMWPFPGTGHNWPVFLQEMGCFAPYGRGGENIPLECARTFAKPGTHIGLCYGGYLYNAFARRSEQKDLEWQKWRIWSGLLRGFTSQWWYAMGAGGSENGMSEGYAPYPSLRVMAQEAERINQGFYKLFARARRDYGPVAMHDSMPSVLLESMVGDFNDRVWDLHLLMEIVQDHVGHQFTYVTHTQVAEGELKKYRVLMMPLSVAIDKAEADAMRKYVENGGLLIADVRPGLADIHGNLNNNKAMCELFGISYKPDLGRKRLVGEVAGEYKGLRFASQAPKFPADPALELKSAKAALKIEGIPLVTSNDVGKGSAVCLNIPFNYYYGYPTPDSLYKYHGEPRHNRMVGSIMTAILKAHKVERVVNADIPEGEWLWGLETPYHVDGKAQYLSITKRRRTKAEPDGYPVTLHAPRAGHVYDMFAGKYLGERESWEVKVAAADVQLFSILPYRVGGLQVDLDGKKSARGESITGKVMVDTGGADPVRHFVHLAVVRPDGQAVRYLAQTFETVNGALTFSIPLAMNEPLGTWELTFRDVATGTKDSVRVEVRKQ
jgi:hypothetical protein